MNATRLALLIAISLLLAAGGCIERLPPRPPPEVPPYPQEKFDSPRNAWHWYQRASDLLARESERVQFPRGPLSDHWARRAAEYVKERQAALEALDRAIAAPYCVVPRYHFEGEPFPRFANIRELARLRILQGRVLAHQGDTTGAVTVWPDTVEMGHDIMQQGMLIVRLVGFATDAMGSTPLIGLAQQGYGTEAGYRQIIKRLTNLEAYRFPCLETLGREFADCRDMFMRAVELDGGDWDLDTIAERLWWAMLRGVILSNYDTCWSIVIEDAGRPYHQRDRTFTEQAVNDPVNKHIFPMYSRMRVQDLHDVARLRGLVLMAALQLYRLDHGALPPTVEALRPEYLPDLPLDPFSEQPYRYLRTPGDVFVVYSVGPDGDDDRAEVEYHRRRGAESDGDIIFREGDGEQ